MRPLFTFVFVMAMMTLSYCVIAQNYTNYPGVLPSRQEFRLQDSLLTAWVNNLAKNANLPIDTIRKMELDSAVKVVHKWRKDAYAKAGITMKEDGVYPNDSATVTFFIKERIDPQLLKK